MTAATGKPIVTGKCFPKEYRQLRRNPMVARQLPRRSMVGKEGSLYGKIKSDNAHP